MNLQNPRRNELTPVPFLNNALDFILSQINKIWLVEHDGDGHHTDITATSIDFGDSGAVDEDGNATFNGDTHTLGEFVFESGTSQTQEKLTIAGETDGWRISRKTASSPLNGTYALAIYDMASSAFPVLEIGTIGGVYHILPHDSATVALGYNGGTSSDRFSSLTVQSGVYESSRTVANGHWQADAFNAANFTASSGTWTVDSGDVTQLRYTVQGNTMTVAFFIVGTDVSATPTDLRITIPGGYTCAAATRNCISTVDAGGTPQFGMVLVSTGNTTMFLYRDATATQTWTATASDNTTVAGQITFEIQ